MSNSNGINTLARSINGIITYSDGSGTLIQNGKIITITLTANIINAINLIISSIGCNGILTIGSATTTEIKIIPTGNLTLGSATSTDTLIQNSDGVIMGQTPSSYNSVTGLMDAPGMRFENKSGTSILDFHSNTVGSGQTDSRIISTGGTATALHGTLAMTSGTLNLSAMDTTNISNLTTNINSTTKIEFITPLLNLIATVVKMDYILPLTLDGPIMLGDKTKGAGLPLYYGVRLQGVRNALSYYQATTGQPYPTWIEAVSNGTSSGFDFHSNGANNVDYDARIECNSATTGSTAGTGTMDIKANIINLDALSTTNITSPTGIVLTTPSTKISMQGLNGLVLTTSGTGSVNASINFYSSGLSPYASRILSFGGDSTVGNGRLEMYSGTIYVRPLGNLDMGTATSPNTFIRNTDGLIIGQDPITYNSALGTMDAPGMRFLNAGVNSLIDFHSNNVGSTNLDSRIQSTGGTTTALNGTLNISSGTINLSAPTIVNLITGQTNVSVQGTNGLRMKVDGTASCNSYIDFHSAGTGQASSRIISTGGSATAFNGTLGIQSGTINLTSSTTSIRGTVSSSLACNASGGGCYVNAYPSSLLISSSKAGSLAQSNIPFFVNAGLMFNRGTFGSSVGGMMFTAGGYVHPNNLGANSATTATVSFDMTFGTGSVYLTVYTYSTDAASMGVVSSFQGTTTTGFVANFYNSRSVTAPGNTYGLNYVAFGKN